jgi:Fe-S oxidoreductase
LIFLQEDILKYAGIKFLKGAFYLTFEVVMDTFGLFLVIGSLMALYRRLIIKPEYLESNAFDYILLLALLFMGVSGFILEGMRLSITQPPWAKYSYFGYIFSWFFARESLQTIYPIIWWAHALVAFSIIAVIPYTKLFHIVLIPTNLVFADLKPSGKLTTPFNLLQIMESEEDMDIEVGISKTSELKWKKRVEVDACVNCGRCQEVCPAYAAGRDLSPRLVIQEVKTHLSDRDKTLINGTISENTIWSCTNCYGCVEECPAHIHHVDLITDFRRFLIGDGKIDEQKITILSNLDRNGNPYGVPSYQRAEWLNSLEAPKVMDNPDFEYLYWIGCAGSIDSRAQNITRSMIQILNKAGINYAILGEYEKCSGEIAKRLGEEGRFQQIALENIEIFEMYGVKKIITHCPHCFNVFKLEYPELGGKYKVIHHSEFIARLIKDGRLKIEPFQLRNMIYHDPCNLGRINGIYDEPRDILKASGAKLIEPENTKSKALCCGGGGGNSFYSVPEETKISQIRIKELTSHGVNIISVACPFCMSMFEDAKKTAGLEESIQIKDLAEIIADIIRI